MPHRRAAALGRTLTGCGGCYQVKCLDLAAVTYSCLMPAKPDPAEIGDVEPLADSTARQARRVVAAYATDADECRIFLSMLGIGPAKNES
jgi:hypothetical protein